MRRLFLSITLLLSLALPAFAQPNHSDIARAVAAENAGLLATNTKEADVQFLLKLLAALPPAEHWGLLSKSNGENGITLPSGVRVSHDVIALPSGERVDVVGGSDNPGVPASVTWNPIPPAQWRASNVYVSPDGLIPPPSTPPSTGGGGTTVPPASVSLKPVLDAIAALDARIAALPKPTPAPSLDPVMALLVEISVKLDAIAATVQNGRDRLEDLVTMTDNVQKQLANPPAYKGNVLGMGVTLRPSR